MMLINRLGHRSRKSAGLRAAGFHYSKLCSRNWEMIFCVEMPLSMV
jgi:hypothetical protein